MNECLSCGAPLLPDAESCEACGAVVPESDADPAVTLWQYLALIGTIGGILVGMGLGIFTSNPRSAQIDRAATLAEQRAEEEAAREMLETDWRMANEVFRVWIESNTRMGLVDWEEQDGYVLFVMRSPRPNRTTVWETLSNSQREEVVQGLGIEYSAHLMRTGHLDRFEGDAHPPFGLIYEDAERPVAVRNRDGSIRVAPSSR